MGAVNADSSALLESLKNIKAAISSIEASKASINRKYQQLGAEWSDKKYRELGNTVQDCNKAFITILKTLLEGQKYILLLVNSIQEYESVNLNGGTERGNAPVYQSQDVADGAGNNGHYQYCLGVLTHGTVSEDYIGILNARHENAEPGVRKVFDHFADQLQIQDVNYPPDQTPHYSPMSYASHNRGVYYNAGSDKNNPRGAGTTYYHELAHMIDHAAAGFRGNLSNTPEFANALIEDGQGILSAYNNLSSEGQAVFLNRIRQDPAHSFSDLIDATTSGQLRGSYGHSQDYWRRPGNLQAEAFAHFFEASMGENDKMELLANFFPTAFGIFRSIIESIQASDDVMVLERRLHL